MESKYWNQIDFNCPLNDYPRPQMKRDRWVCLNGEWDCTRYSSDRIIQRKVLVPFSIESKINKSQPSLKPNEKLILKRQFSIPEDWTSGSVLLHLDAVDQSCQVYVNRRLVAENNSGYFPIVVDITGFLTDLNELRVEIADRTDQSFELRGKQSLHPNGIWYTAQSGIWQTVWLENVPDCYIDSLKITPIYDETSVEIIVYSLWDCAVTIRSLDDCASGMSNQPIVLKLSEHHAWSPDDPYLYPLHIQMGEDCVESYFGLRVFEVKSDENHIKRLYLNHEPLYHSGLLDQGYNCDGLMSWPCDQAMIDDILFAKSMGFNMLRKHVKIEPLRWYYHCDRLGMLVWQDMVNGGEKYNPIVTVAPKTKKHFNDHHYWLFNRKEQQSRDKFIRDLKKMIRHLYNTVSIAMWVPFNEGWGQFDAENAVKVIQSIDSTRTVDHASGWHDQGIGDFLSIHLYGHPFRFYPDRLHRAIILSEFGGCNLKIKNHFDDDIDYGYHRLHTPDEFNQVLKKMWMKELIPAKRSGLAASVYTQLSDVEQEANGLITYDRKVIKIDVEMMKELNHHLIKE